MTKVNGEIYCSLLAIAAPFCIHRRNISLPLRSNLIPLIGNRTNANLTDDISINKSTKDFKSKNRN